MPELGNRERREQSWLDVDELIVAEAYCGKNITLKRGARGRAGRFGKIMNPSAN